MPEKVGYSLPMTDCCSSEGGSAPTAPPRCPQTGVLGHSVRLQTLKSMLVPSALQRLELTPSYFFCPDAGCSVVYFADNGATFSVDDVRVAVTCKVAEGEKVLCYCFGETEQSLIEEYRHAGTCQAEGRIREHIAAGRCACELRNPRGTCCLGDVISAVKRIANG